MRLLSLLVVLMCGNAYAGECAGGVCPVARVPSVQAYSVPTVVSTAAVVRTEVYTTVASTKAVSTRTYRRERQRSLGWLFKRLG